MNSPVSLAREFTQQHFPNCYACLITGSQANKRKLNLKKDIDLIVFGNDLPSTTVFNYNYYKVNIDIVYISINILENFFYDKKRSGRMFEMILKGRYVTGDRQLILELQLRSRISLQEISKKISISDLHQTSINFSRIIDCLDSTTDDFAVQMYVVDLYRSAIDYAIYINYGWHIHGKYRYKALKELNSPSLKKLHEAFVNCFRIKSYSDFIDTAKNLINDFNLPAPDVYKPKFENNFDPIEEISILIELDRALAFLINTIRAKALKILQTYFSSDINFYILDLKESAQCNQAAIVIKVNDSSQPKIIEKIVVDFEKAFNEKGIIVKCFNKNNPYLDEITSTPIIKCWYDMFLGSVNALICKHIKDGSPKQKELLLEQFSIFFNVVDQISPTTDVYRYISESTMWYNVIQYHDNVSGYKERAISTQKQLEANYKTRFESEEQIINAWRNRIAFLNENSNLDRHLIIAKQQLISIFKEIDECSNSKTIKFSALESAIFNSITLKGKKKAWLFYLAFLKLIIVSVGAGKEEIGYYTFIFSKLRSSN